MEIYSILFLFLSNAVSLRRDKSFLYSRATIIISGALFLISSLYTNLDTINLYVYHLNKDMYDYINWCPKVSLHNEPLFQSTFLFIARVKLINNTHFYRIVYNVLSNIIYLAMFYILIFYFNVRDFYCINNIALDLCVASLELINRDYLSLLKTYFYTFIHMIYNLYFIVKEIISFFKVLKLITFSVIFRTILLILTLALEWQGLNSYIVRLLAFIFIWGSILFLFFKSDNKTKYTIKLAFNLFILISFWSILGYCCGTGFITLFLLNNIIFIFGDWGMDTKIIEAMNSLDLHTRGIGDPGPQGPQGPLIALYGSEETENDPDKSEHSSDDTERSPDQSEHNLYKNEIRYGYAQTKSKWYMDDPGTNYYKNQITVKGKTYKSPYLERAIKFNTELSNKSEHELAVREAFVRLLEPNFGVLDTELGLKIHSYNYSFEFNTLYKANLYLKNNGLDSEGKPLSSDYEEAYEGWRRRQISLSSNKVMDQMCDNLYKHDLINSKFYPDKYRSSTINNIYPTKYHFNNYFDEKLFSNLVRENFLWISLFLQKCDALLQSDIDFNNINRVEWLVDDPNNPGTKKWVISTVAGAEERILADEICNKVNMCYKKSVKFISEYSVSSSSTLISLDHFFKLLVKQVFGAYELITDPNNPPNKIYVLKSLRFDPSSWLTLNIWFHHTNTYHGTSIDYAYKVFSKNLPEKIWSREELDYVSKKELSFKKVNSLNDLLKHTKENKIFYLESKKKIPSHIKMPNTMFWKVLTETPNTYKHTSVTSISDIIFEKRGIINSGHSKISILMYY